VITPATFRERRNRVRAMLGDAVLLIEGGVEGIRGDLRGGFFQDPNFAWLSGWLQPGAALLLAPKDEKDRLGDILFLPDQDKERTLWAGPLRDAGSPGIRAASGFASVQRMAKLEDAVATALRRYPRILCLSGSDTEERLRKQFPFREVSPADSILARLRMKKSAEEIQAIRKAVSITIAGQKRAWQSLQQSSYEYEVVADITHEFLRLGAERHSFAPIIAGGKNACVLHYSRNRDPLQKGALAVVDIGAEHAGYCGDLTRTIPIRSRFTARQRALYQAVLDVQKEVIAAVRPGASISRQIPGSLHHLAVSLFSKMRLRKGRKSLADAFPHGIGHHLGMEVHDPNDPLALLEPGMVITVEPGVYLPEEGIGIRIEENVLVTEQGCEVLSAALPREIEEVEEILGL
jgi:Xaa-Pro aminopeptidase